MVFGRDLIQTIRRSRRKNMKGRREVAAGLTIPDGNSVLGPAGTPPPGPSAGGLPGSIPLYYVGFAVGRVGSFAALPIISRVLGAEDFGRFEVYVALMLIASIIFDAGAGASIVRFFEDGRFSRGQLLRAAAYVQAGASLFAIAAVGPVLMVLVSSGAALLSLGAVVLFAVVEGFAVIGGALLRVQGRDRAFVGLSLTRFAIAVGVGSIGATAGPVGALFGIALGGLGFAVFAMMAIARESNPDAGPATRALARYGIPLVATSAMTWCLSVSDRIFLNANVSPNELGEYGANYRLGSVISVFLAGPLVLAWVPTIRRVAGETERTEICVRWSSRFALVSLGSLVILLVLAPKGVPVVFGTEFHKNDYAIGAAGLSGWLLGLTFLIATPILLGDRTGLLAVVAAIVAVVNLTLNSMLIPAYGVPGAAIATIASYALFCLVTIVAVGPSAVAAWFARLAHVTLIVGLLGCVLLAVLFPWAAFGATIGIAIASRPWAGMNGDGRSCASAGSS
jgi:O-antigen/teichoic acid export membrane protein